MLKIINFYDVLNKKAEKVQNVFFDNFVFIESTDFLKEGELSYKSIFSINIHKNEVTSYDFPLKARIVSSSNSGSTFYYAQIHAENGNGSVLVQIRKLDLITLHDQEVLDITIDTLEQDQPFDYVALNSNIVGINERYCLFLAPHEQFKYGSSYFSECFLIDTLEKKIFPVKGEFSNSDHLLRVQDIWVTDDGHHLIVKTGRIQEREKRDFWESAIRRGELPSYMDQTESLIILETEKFITQTRNSDRLMDTVIDSADYESGLSVIGLNNNRLIYTKTMFKEEQMTINSYTISLADLKQIKVNHVTDTILYSHVDNKYYIMEHMVDEHVRICIQDLSKNPIFYVQDAGVIYIDDEEIITYRQAANFEKIIHVNSIRSGELIQTFQSRDFHYDFERGLLFIY